MCSLETPFLFSSLSLQLLSLLQSLEHDLPILLQVLQAFSRLRDRELFGVYSDVVHFAYFQHDKVKVGKVFSRFILRVVRFDLPFIPEVGKHQESGSQSDNILLRQAGLLFSAQKRTDALPLLYWGLRMLRPASNPS